VFVLAIYWLATFIAFRGVEAFAKVSKWGGIIGTIIPAAILIVLGFAYLIGGGAPQIELSWSKMLPDFNNCNNVVLAASIFLFYAGMEMNAIHVKDVDNPTRNYPNAPLAEQRQVALIVTRNYVAVMLLTVLLGKILLSALGISTAALTLTGGDDGPHDVRTARMFVPILGFLCLYTSLCSDIVTLQQTA
jgi:amino acid transporter